MPSWRRQVLKTLSEIVVESRKYLNEWSKTKPKNFKIQKRNKEVVEALTRERGIKQKI